MSDTKQTGTIADYVGRRVLVMPKATYGHKAVEEMKIIELSPSGAYVRTMNIHGQKVWRPTADVVVVEVLVLPEPYPVKA